MVNFKCFCCDKEISERQWDFCRLCGFCDVSGCHKPEIFRELQERYIRLKSKWFVSLNPEERIKFLENEFEPSNDIIEIKELNPLKRIGKKYHDLEKKVNKLLDELYPQNNTQEKEAGK